MSFGKVEFEEGEGCLSVCLSVWIGFCGYVFDGWLGGWVDFGIGVGWGGMLR